MGRLFADERDWEVFLCVLAGEQAVWVGCEMNGAYLHFI